MSEQHYIRARIRGSLTVKSPLHIGTGDVATEKQQDEKISYLEICLDHQQKPYLPASTLRGFLADIAQADQVFHQTLFGKGGIQSNQGNAGCLRVYDARLRKMPEFRGQTLRSQISINPVTGTADADAHQLFTHKYVPAGTVFDLHLEADNISHTDLQRLLGLLECQASIGKGRSKGQGKLAWFQERLEGVTEHEMTAWLQEADDSALPFTDINHLTPQGNWQAESAKSWQFELHPQSPFMVRDPWYTEPDDDEEKTATPAHYCRYPDGQAIIPASTLAGWLRGRARRILLSILAETREDGIPQEEDKVKADNLLNEIFGSTDKRSLIWLEDAVAEGTNAKEQDFIAIDRFTGGVAVGKGKEKDGGKLYKVKAATCNYLHSSITLYPEKIKPQTDWWKALLLLVLRDALEDEIVIGWGKGRGYGVFSLKFHHNDKGDSAYFYAQLKQYDVASYLEALRTELL